MCVLFLMIHATKQGAGDELKNINLFFTLVLHVERHRTSLIWKTLYFLAGMPELPLHTGNV